MPTATTGLAKAGFPAANTSTVVRAAGTGTSPQYTQLPLEQPREFLNSSTNINTSLDGVANLPNSGAAFGQPTGYMKLLNVTIDNKMVYNEKDPNWTTGVREQLFNTSGNRNEYGQYVTGTVPNQGPVNFSEPFLQNYGMDTDASRSVYTASGNYHYRLGKLNITGFIQPPTI